MPKRPRIPREGPEIFTAPDGDRRPTTRIGPLTLLSGKRGYLTGKFPVVPKLRSDSDQLYCGEKKK